MGEVGDVEVCRINRAIFVGEADDILRLGAKPESALYSDLLRDTESKYVNTLNGLRTSTVFSYPACSL